MRVPKRTVNLFSIQNKSTGTFISSTEIEREKATMGFWHTQHSTAQSTQTKNAEKILNPNQIEILHWRSCGHMLEWNWIEF